MFETDPVLELNPASGTVVELVKKLVDEPWPRSDEERENLFEHLGFESGSGYELENEESPHQMTEQDICVGGQTLGSWATYNREFLSVTVHLYGTQEPGDPAAQSGFNELRIHLSELFGKPEHPWDNEETSPCIWKANGRTITTHLFNRRDSVVMLSGVDTALAAVAEAYAISG